MDWKKPEDELPLQGKKILYFSNGDIYVVQRFGPYWWPIPFVDSKYKFNEPPQLWADIYPPGNLTGKMYLQIDDELHDIDSLEKYHPDIYQELIFKQKAWWDQNDR